MSTSDRPWYCASAALDRSSLALDLVPRTALSCRPRAVPRANRRCAAGFIPILPLRYENALTRAHIGVEIQELACLKQLFFDALCETYVEIWINITATFVGRAVFEYPGLSVWTADGEVTPKLIELSHCRIQFGFEKNSILGVFVVL